ncbi:MAG: DUF2924 domain-containing protein [Ralstonia sp.]|nr:DUF2924 domain-containing protein [Ralstonia sp.]
MDELKTQWRRLFGSDAPTHNRRFLERRIAYKLQEVEFRKEDAKLLEHNQRQITALIETGKLRRRDRDVRPAAGTVLAREYRGVVHHVIVSADGQYEYQGRPFPSLSMIAREITGTRWSGPVFFGLKAASTKGQNGNGGRR